MDSSSIGDTIIVNNYMKYTKDQLQDIINNTNTIKDFCIKIGWKPEGGFYNMFHQLVIKYDLDISHYKYTNDMKYNSHFVSKNPKDILSELVSKGEREYKCELCGLTTIWNNKPLILQIHHKDGNHYNNDPENLQYLCPNCHSQTDNYTGRNRCKIQKEIKYCSICGKELSKTNTTGLCAVCLRKLYRNINRPDKDELLNLIIHNSFSKVAKLCNVSDRTIIKWLKQDKLPYTRKLINDYIKENNIDI